MKITKGHYNRKLLTFGVMLFLAIALISTGFAAWIMSSGAEKGFEDENISVGVITESDLEFTKFDFGATKTALSFDAKKDDQAGDIKGSESSVVNLSFTFTTKISPAEFLDEIQIKMTFPQSLVDAHNAKYIILPDCALNETPITIAKMSDTKVLTPTNTDKGVKVVAEPIDDTDEIKLTITVEIKWGTAFGGENPSVYLDETATNAEGDKLTSAEKKKALYDFRRTIFGQPEMSDSEIATHEAVLKYSLTLYATVN